MLTTNLESAATRSLARPYLLLEQADSLFAIALGTIREVIPLSESNITAVPNTLPLVMGLFNLRGEIIAVADFGDLIGETPTSKRSEHSRIVVLEASQTRFESDLPIGFAIAVSRVAGVAHLESDRVTSAAEVGSKLTPLLQGLYRWNGQLLMLVDTRAVADVLGASST